MNQRTRPLPITHPMFRNRFSGLLQAVAAAWALSLAAIPVSGAQWVAVPRQAFAGAAHSSSFAHQNPAASALLNAADYHVVSMYESLWRQQGTSMGRDSVGHASGATAVTKGARFSIEVASAAPEFAKLVPELSASLDWGRQFRIAVLDVLGRSRVSPRERDGAIAELVSQYRARTDLALSAIPKAFDLPDGQGFSLEFRQRLPKSNGLTWATRWSELALYEALLADSNNSRASVDLIVNRAQKMISGAPMATPFLLPIAPAVAPSFASRYPDAAAIVDNLHMLEDGIADILVAQDVPRSAKRLELLRLRDAYRSDTMAAISVAQWMSSVQMIGANNMGGPGVGFTTELPTPTVSRGASMVGMSTHDHSAMGAAPGTAPTSSQAAQPTLEAMLAIHARMMSDPVIRERVATDPVLQKMLAGISLDSAAARAAGAMAGMDHANMPGMTPSSAARMLAGTPEQRAQALDFVVRLLSDPAVEARTHTSAELHALWSDPEVQKRLAELKKKPPVKPPVTP